MKFSLSETTTGILLSIVAAAVLMTVMAGTVHALEQKPIKLDAMDFEVSSSLKEREENVRLKEEEQQKREEELAAMKNEVETKLAALVKLQQEVKEQLAALNNSNDTQFNNLIKVYSTMSPTKAAPLLNKMDDVIVTRILRAMKPDFVAKLIPKLDPDKAVSVSKKLGMLNNAATPQ